MTKDSRRSSVAGSAPSIQENIDQEATPRGSSNVSVNGSRTDAADSTLVTDKVTELEASAAVLSNDASKDVHSSLSGPTPYGTRSRNRTGAGRPNYAEDKELDTEFDVVSASDNITRRTSRHHDVYSTSETNQSTANSKKHNTNDTENASIAPSYSKESPAAISSFSATTSVQPALKKRKVAAHSSGNSTTGNTQVPGAQNDMPTAHVSSSRLGTSALLVPGFRETNMLGFETCGGQLKNNILVADDGTRLEVNDHVYLVCEPPGEPYYLGRIMEFLHANNDPKAPIDALRLNWYYRPKDIGRIVNDTRQVFASMHSDISPLTALRGKCQIKHKSEVEKLDDVRRAKDTFWYEKLYDRYIHRFYDVVPTSQVINVPVEVKKVLDERWRYIIVEPGRGKELTSAVKSCKRCSKYCASNDSVDCAVCGSTYHMSCVSPPLLKKPSRGFAWACGPCSKAQEKKLEARNTPSKSEQSQDAENDAVEEDVDSPGAQTTPVEAEHTSPSTPMNLDISQQPGTAEQIHQASLWLFRYLGIHCKVEDALDYDDRIYPRASSRLGPRHQAVVPPWYGRPVEYVKPETKRKFLKGGTKKDPKLSKEAIAAMEADKAARESRPKWVMDEPTGYVARGEDYDDDDERNTAKLLYKHPEEHDLPGGSNDSPNSSVTSPDPLVFGYMARAGSLARSLGLPELSTNLLDVALETLYSLNFDSEKALEALQGLNKKQFKEPELTAAELKRFEDGVSKYGSEWHSIKKHVKTLKAKDVVRFYYTWKKTARGQQVWGNYSGRKNKKEAKRAEATGGKLQDDVADEHDDSAFDNDKAYERRRGFQCKFCSTRSSRQWRRAPNTPAGTMVLDNPGAKAPGKEKGSQLMIALCRRCAELWRRYAIQWEDIDEVAKKTTQAGGRTWKRKIDEELLNELVAANEVVNDPPGATFPPVPISGTTTPSVNGQSSTDASKKKSRSSMEVTNLDSSLEATASQRKKVMLEKPVLSAAPELPKPKLLPCAICGELEPVTEQLLACRECRMSVHRNCYGVMSDNRALGKWVCDMCSNDKNPQVSIQYKCMLCPIEHTEHDFIEPVRNTNKKRSEKDRERERMEREQNTKAAEFYRKRQEESNKPVNPREPLKRTANNNWVHVTCAVFTPEVKFGNAKAMEPSEGIPLIASSKYDEICRVCKRRGGACIACHSCKSSVHVECAHQAGYLLGFDIVPVKGSRRDQVNVVNINGEVGTMTAAVWCKDHIPTKTIVHQMHDIVDENGLNALQLYVQTFKQADLTLTGTVRKATLVNQSTKASPVSASTNAANRRVSTSNLINHHPGPRSLVRSDEGLKHGHLSDRNDHTCATCHIHISPKWWPFGKSPTQTTYHATVMPSIETNIDQSGQQNALKNTGIQQETDGDTGQHVALAAAALHQNRPVAGAQPLEVQCHKCHWRNVKRESPVIPIVGNSTASETTVLENQNIAAISGPINTVDRGSNHTAAHYAWPHPSNIPTNGVYTLGRSSPSTQGYPNPTLSNGHTSPQLPTGQNETTRVLHMHAPQSQSVNGHSHMRSPAPPPVPHSPRQNGQVLQGLNGYTNSPLLYGPSQSLSNGTYPSYASTRPPIQHLTNGGPSPRSLDHSLHADVPVISHSRGQSFSGLPTSPSRGRHPQSFLPGRESSPIARSVNSSFRTMQSEPPVTIMSRVGSVYPPTLATPAVPVDSRQSREADGLPLIDRSNDRTNGGASASPSLQNLLS